MSLHTESSNTRDNLHLMSIAELVQGMNEEDHSVAFAVQEALPQIVALAELVYTRLEKGGRLFYLGAGTSGRLGCGRCQ